LKVAPADFPDFAILTPAGTLDSGFRSVKNARFKRPWRDGVSMGKKHEVRILKNNCKGCGICVHYCPKKTLEMSEEFTPKGYHPPEKKKGTECSGCRVCERMCPDFAIFIEEEAQ